MKKKHQDPGRRPVSERQHAANRANAQKSTGPTSKAGKLVSRANALKHYLCSTVCVLSAESHERFEALTRAYHDHFLPRDEYEQHLITDLVSIHWNGDRIRFVEHGLYEMELQDPVFLERNGHHKDKSALLVLAFGSVAGKGLLATVNRTISRINREYTRLLQVFTDHRGELPPAASPTAPAPVSPAPAGNKKVKNEPIPTTGHEQPKACASPLAALRSVFNFNKIKEEEPPPLAMTA